MADGRRRRFTALLAGVLAFGVLAACGSAEEAGPVVSGVSKQDDRGYEGTYLDDPFVVPDIALTDTDGKAYSLATSPAPVKVVFFGYTNCPDICQIVMSTVASATSRLDDDQRRDVEVVFVTTDPARDDEKALRAYLDHLDPAFVGLTGDLDRIIDLATPLKIFVEKGKRLPSGGYEVDHTTYVLGITGDQTRLVWSQAVSPADLAADIIRLRTSALQESR